MISMRLYGLQRVFSVLCFGLSIDRSMKLLVSSALATESHAE